VWVGAAGGMAPARAAAAVATVAEVLTAVQGGDLTALTASVSAAAHHHLAAANAPRGKGVKDKAVAAVAASVVPLAVPLAQAALAALTHNGVLAAEAEECLCACAAAALDALWAVRDVLEVKPLELHRQLYALVRTRSPALVIHARREFRHRCFHLGPRMFVVSISRAENSHPCKLRSGGG
jgi:hypothetical protein